MHTLTVWKDLILLHWNFDKPPQGCLIPIGHIKANPECVIPYWKAIQKHVKWNKKLNAFTMSLSRYNLLRIHEQFGQIPVTSGQWHIDALKSAHVDMNKCTARAVKIKGGSLEDIQYKMNPLGGYQHVGVNLLTFCEKVPLFAEPGLGKTFMVLASTQEQFRRGLLRPGKVLVCGKLMTLETGWLADCEKFTHMKATMLWAKPGAKRKEKLLKLLEEPADIYIINHDGVRVLEDELVAKKFEKVVIDESTILKGYRGERAQSGAFGKSIIRIAESAKWRVIMSGTPAPNGPQDLWGQMKFLDPWGFILERSFRDFQSRFMRQVFFGDPSNPNTPSTWVPTEESIGEVAELTSPLSYRVRIRDHLKDLPEKTIMVRRCRMTAEQMTHYVSMATALMTEIDAERISVDIALAKLSKLRQITGGFIIDAEEVPHPLDENPKIDMMDTLLLEEIPPEHKVVIYAQFRWEIELLESRYKDLGVRTVYGGNSGSTNLENIKAFINDPKIRLIVMHPASAAHGITLVCAHYMIFYSSSYSSEADSQCQARIERAGQKHPMFIYYLSASSADPGICEETIDEIMFAVIREKNATQQTIIDADVVNRFRNSVKQRGEKCSRRKKK